MKRISFNPRFVNTEKNDLIPGKIHTIRKNYEFWKKFEGQEIALFMWEGDPYRSKQYVFCVKKIVLVQEIMFDHKNFWLVDGTNYGLIPQLIISKNDGFNGCSELRSWFRKNYPCKLAILHFTDFKY